MPGCGNTRPRYARTAVALTSTDGSQWLNRPSLIQEEMPDQVVANMGLAADDVVADIGALLLANSSCRATSMRAQHARSFDAALD